MRGPDPDRARWLASQILPHEPQLRGWLASRVPANLEADDVVQEAYAILAALESVDHIRSPRNYLFQTAHSLILRHLRRNRVVPFETVADMERFGVTCDAPSAEDQVDARQRLAWTRGLLAALPGRCREAFVLRTVLNLPQKEIARRMGLSESTVEKHIGKAMRRLSSAVAHGGIGTLHVSKGAQAQAGDADKLAEEESRRARRRETK